MMPSRTTMTASSWTASFRIAGPRTPDRPVGVAICERLRMSRALLTLGAIHRCDRKLVRFLLRIEHQELLDRVERRLQLVPRAAALDFQILNRALEIRDAAHRLRYETLRKQLGIFYDQL